MNPRILAAALAVLAIGVPGLLMPAAGQTARINPLLERLEQGGAAGPDVWQTIDMEHGPYRTRAEALRAVRSMRIPPQRGTKFPDPPGIRGAGLWSTDGFTGFPVAACGKTQRRTETGQAPV